MKERLLEVYESELRYLRELSGEFAESYPKVAGRLALRPESGEAEDPFVERLLEGVAFMTARVRIKMEAEFPTFTQSLLETVAPDLLAPVPSMAMIQFTPDPNLKERATIDRGTVLRGNSMKADMNRCVFRTAHEIGLWPIELVTDGPQAPRYYDRDIDRLSLPSRLSAKAAIRLTLKTRSAVKNFGQLEGFDELPIFLAGAEGPAGQIYEACLANCSHLVIRAGSDAKCRSAAIIGRDENPISQMGFSESEALLPKMPQSFSGYRLLREYFAMPHRFFFLNFSGLAAVADKLQEDTIELIVVLDRANPQLEGHATGKMFELFVSPAINLFEKRTNNLLVTKRQNEFHLMPDRTRPLDFEIYAVKNLIGFGKQRGKEMEFLPFFRRSDMGSFGQAYFATRREPRRLSSKERTYRPVSSYLGSEVYASIVDRSAVPYSPDLREIAAKVWCSNRHLPIKLRESESSSLIADTQAPVEEVRCLIGPTDPAISWVEGEYAWRLINHLSLNYQSLLNRGEDGAAAIREILSLYQPGAETDEYHWIQGIEKTECRSIVRRCPNPGPVAFSRGLEIRLLLNEEKFVGASPFLFGAVMASFFARYVSTNSFTETVIDSRQRGQVMHWPGSVGTRHLL